MIVSGNHGLVATSMNNLLIDIMLTLVVCKWKMLVAVYYLLVIVITHFT